jgi:2-keto-4-pentenoate hydratase/2-oxohepta-3-ene-1,7-dioic acid hydratase in catechol pathway
MRFVTYAEDGGDRVGVLDHDGQIHPLAPGVTMLDLLRRGTLREAGEQALSSSTTAHSVTEVRLRAPLPDPPTVRDFMAFERHVEGVAKLGGADKTVPPQWYEAPAFYFTNPYAILGPADDVPIAPGSRMFDLELEVAAVIGRTGRDIHPADADAYIAGYTILIDWSARDLQFAEMQVRLGPAKGKDTATTLGPILVTPDELLAWRTDTGYDLAMTARINDQQIGTDHWSSMAFSFADMIAYASRGTQVRPGDIIGSGTCGGGCLAELWGRHGRDAHPPLQPGDLVTVTVEQLGTLTVRITEGVEPVPIASARRSR